MSKLRADITWKYRINSNINISPPLNILEDIDEENVEEDYNKDAEKNAEIEEEENEEKEEEEENLTNLEEELGNYLQGWQKC